MIAQQLLIVGVAGLMAVPPEGGGTPGVRAHAIGIQVYDTTVNLGAFDLSVFGGAPGTTVSVLLSAPEGKSIVSVDPKASRIRRFEDAAGNDMFELEDAGRKPAGGMMGMMLRDRIARSVMISRDRSMAVVDVSAPIAPRRGAASVTVEGVLVVRLAAGTVKREIGGVGLSPGRLELDDLGVEIIEAGPTDWEDVPMSVVLRLDGDTAQRIADLRFLNAVGQPISADGDHLMTMAGTTDVEFGLT